MDSRSQADISRQLEVRTEKYHEYSMIHDECEFTKFREVRGLQKAWIRRARRNFWYVVKQQEVGE